MFLGHFAVGFAAKRAAPRTSLVTLVVAALFLDLLWPVFLLLHWERVRIESGNTAFTALDFVHYPLSHSLLMSVVWAALFALVYRARTGYAKGALWVGIAVASHWVLDFVSHRPDLPLFPGGTLRLGLGLWNSRVGTLLVEGVMFAAGLWIYLAGTRARNRIGTMALWAFVALIVGLYAANASGPPPPSIPALAAVTLLAWVILAPWIHWFDRNRAPVLAAAP